MTPLGWIRRAKDERGTAVVEMALVLPILLLLALGVGGFGVGLNRKNDATQLANVGARWAAVNANPAGIPLGTPSGSCSVSGTTLQDVIRSQADTCGMYNTSTVCIDFPDGIQKVGHPVEVKVKTNWTWLGVQFFPKSLSFSNLTIVGRAVMRLEQQPPPGTPFHFTADPGC